MMNITLNTVSPNYNQSNSVLIKKQQKQTAYQPLKADNVQFSRSAREAMPTDTPPQPIVTTAPTDNLSTMASATPVVLPSSPLPLSSPAVAGVQPVAPATPNLGLIGTIAGSFAGLGVLGLGFMVFGQHGEINGLKEELNFAKQATTKLENKVTKLTAEMSEKAQQTVVDALDQRVGIVEKAAEKAKKIASWGAKYASRIETLPENAPVIAKWANNWFVNGLESFADLKGKFFDRKSTFFNNDTDNIALRKDARFLHETVLPAFETHIETLADTEKTKPKMETLLATVKTLKPAFTDINPETALESPEWKEIVLLPTTATEVEKLAAEIRNYRLKPTNGVEGLKPLVEEVYTLLKEQLEGTNVA
ncbi:MAG: hypothetical protein H2174_01525 [Vampirovibrio sp.]|nr:hypothetical protein [Vampirovibrio sp.]